MGQYFSENMQQPAMWLPPAFRHLILNILWPAYVNLRQILPLVYAQTVMTILFNSTYFNLQKAVENQYIPYFFYMKGQYVYSIT